MNIIITKHQAECVGFEKFELYGLNDRSWGWRKNTKCTLDLDALERHKLDQLEKIFTEANAKFPRGIHGVSKHIDDIRMWKDALDGAMDGTAVKNLRQLQAAMTEFLRTIPGHRVYQKDEKLGQWLAYYVSSISYKAEYWTTDWNGRRYKVEAELTLKLEHDHGTDGKTETEKEWTGERSVAGQTVQEALRDRGLFPETDELRAMYEKQIGKFKKWFRSIGKQLLANGEATFQTTKKDDDDYWWRAQTRTFKLANARVVVDVLKEGDQGENEDDGEDEEEDEHSKSSFWKVKRVNEETGEEETVQEPYERPIHPYLRVFHLSKHMQLTLHISSLKRYKYDRKIIKKLVIDEERKSLIKLLVNHDEQKYKDIVGEKGGGAIVLLCGPPGVGKTLTAEVYAESEKRALYSVQCAQLGTTAEEMENELMKVMARAQRWKAVLLLDECDVYVRKRGRDIVQNAIVGVFLRVLEYQNAVMFLTTNRPKDVDDAVASRCIAKIVYKVPNEDEQKEIWRVLSKTTGATMSEEAIEEVAKTYPGLSGRDVKQLLKLSMLVTDGPITAKTVAFVKQFKSA